jgi:hypothetical protein
MDALNALVRLTEELPDELRTVSGRNYSLFLRGIEIIRGTVTSRVPLAFGAPLDERLRNAIADVRAILEPLPDEAPSPATAELSFITDGDLRGSIRNDVSAANRALHDGLWKAATVLAGAAAEALLLWAITEKKSNPDIENARIAVIPSASADPNNWVLDGYIKVARTLGLIEAETEKQVDLARWCRDLIHPGRSTRLAKVCDRGTALSVLAAVELIVRDLSYPQTRSLGPAIAAWDAPKPAGRRGSWGHLALHGRQQHPTNFWHIFKTTACILCLTVGKAPYIVPIASRG